MHNAPAVAYPVGRSSFQGVLLGLLLGCELLTFAAWCLALDTLGWPHVFGGLVICVSGIWTVWAWWHAPAGTLSWDGAAWHVSFQGLARHVKPEVVIDLQGVVLLRLSGEGNEPAVWVWPERSANPLRWMALRRAIHDQRSRRSATQSELNDVPERISP